MTLPSSLNRWFLHGLALLTLAAVATPALGADERPPNIIFIITDDQHRRELGFIDGQTPTPHIDALAHGGMQFDNCYVAASVCTPSRYSALSGQFASRSDTSFFKAQNTEEGITRVNWNPGFTPGQHTLPGVLSDAGYLTGFVGKWHIGGANRAEGTPIAPGADPYDPAVTERLRANQAAFSKSLQANGFDYASRIYAGNPDDDKELKNAGLNIHHMEWVTEGGIEFIEQAVAEDKPFYLYFSTTLTHVPDPVESLPLDPRLTPGGLLDEPIEGLMPSREDVIARAESAGLPKEVWGALWLDDGVGALVAKLRELGIEDNTLIVYFVDHGMEHRSKGTCYEGGLVSPTFFYMPGTVPAGTTQDALIQNVDFAPTFFDLAGVTPPDDMVIDGVSARSLITGDDTPVRDSIYSELGLTRAVRTADGWKYIAFRVPPSLERTLEERLADQQKLQEQIERNHPWARNNPNYGPDPQARYFHQAQAPGGTLFERNQLATNVPFKPHYFDRDQLFNLNEDPDETTNLADDPRYAEKLAEMQAVLKTYLDGLPGTYAELKPTE
ncbi:MAG: sulfatase-like hydrolase/transferase [Planctomycetota bacterium]